MNVWIGLLVAGTLAAQITPYTLQVESGQGLIVVTFSTSNGEARAYFPDDLVSGEPFSGAVESTGGYTLDFAGQRVNPNQESFHWTVPRIQAGEFVPLVLRDPKGREVARASIPVATSASGVPASFRAPKLIQAGRPFPIQGPFDGNSDSASVLVGGQPAQLLAESRRRAIVLCPEQISGPVRFTLKAGTAEAQGEIHSLTITAETPRTSLNAGETSVLQISIAGLAGLQTEVPLRFENKSPQLVRISGEQTYFRDIDYVFIRASEGAPDGTYSMHRQLIGIEPGKFDLDVSLAIPQTPREEVALIMRAPGQPGPNSAQVRAAALRLLEFDSIPLLAELVTSFDLGSDAALAMLILDEPRALQLLFRSVPAAGANVERIVFGWFLDHYDYAHKSGDLTEAHAAALRILSGGPASTTIAQQLALYTVGLTGDTQDFPVLEEYFHRQSGYTGVQEINSASDAALARLGSAEHIKNLEAELAAPLSSPATYREALRLMRSLDKAGYAGKLELAPLVCPHVADPLAVEIDIFADPGLHARLALSAIVDGTNPRISSGRTIENWQAYCRTIAAR